MVPSPSDEKVARFLSRTSGPGQGRQTGAVTSDGRGREGRGGAPLCLCDSRGPQRVRSDSPAEGIPPHPEKSNEVDNCRTAYPTPIAPTCQNLSPAASAGESGSPPLRHLTYRVE